VQRQETHSLSVPDGGEGGAGFYGFEDVDAGRYAIRELQQDGWRQTFPVPHQAGASATDPNVVPAEIELPPEVGGHVVVVESGQAIEDVNFGNAALGSIHGFKFEDVDADGRFDPDIDHPLHGVRFQVGGVDGVGNEVSHSVVTNDRGEFWVGGLLPSVSGEGEGTGYVVAEIVSSGQQPTTPRIVRLNLRSGEELVWRDGVAMLPEDAQVEMDGRLIDREDHRLVGPFTVDIRPGAYELTLGSADHGEAHGSQGQNEEQYYIELYDRQGDLIYQSPLISDLPDDQNELREIVDRNAQIQGHAVALKAFHISELDPGYSYTANSVDPTLAVFRSLDPRHEVVVGERLMFGNTVGGSIHGFKYEDMDGNGAFDPNLDRPLAGVVFHLSGENGQGRVIEDQAVTDERGEFSLDGLLAGHYIVREVVPDGFEATTHTHFETELLSRQEYVWRAGAATLPEGDPRHEVVVGERLMFGNFAFITIGGTKFDDLNGDGQRSGSEPGLAGWTVYLDADGNNQLGVEEAFTTTDGGGGYTFAELGPGSYTVREVQQAGWTQTTASPSTIAAVSGSDVDGVDFGNTLPGSIHGFMFEDRNANGQYDLVIDSPLAGIQFQVNGITGQGQQVELVTDPTNADGEFWIEGLLAGQYAVTAMVPADHTPTTPTSYGTDLLSRQELVWRDGAAMLPPGDPRIEVNVGTALMFGNLVENPEIRVATSSGVQVADDGDVEFDTVGEWSPFAMGGFQGDLTFSASGTGSDTATWTFTNLTPGVYAVAATWVEYTNRAIDAPYSIYDGFVDPGNLIATIDVDQQIAPDDFNDLGADWESLSAVTISGNTLSVQLTDDANGFVIADAVRIEAFADIADGMGMIDFGITDEGSPVSQVFTVLNEGDDPLNLVEPISVPLGFSVTNSFGSTSLNPGESTTFELQLDGNISGMLAGTVSFANNDVDENPFEFTVQGFVNIAAPEIQLLAASGVGQIIDDGDPDFVAVGFMSFSG
ncbi:MAG: SdrD B-like domain-containing protein, partial [Pirellulales bacterium]